MVRAYALVALCGLGLALAAAPAAAAPTFNFKLDPKAPADFESGFQSCIKQFNKAGGLAKQILKQLNGAKLTLYYEKGGGVTGDPNPGGDTAGKALTTGWDPHLGGTYDEDGAPKVPCAVLLHELQHAARYFKGKECNGAMDGTNIDARFYDEQMASRAENFWLDHEGYKKQRTKYDFYGDVRDLDSWTQWPKPAKVPKAPPCEKCGSKASAEAPGGVEAASCSRCTGFHQKGCVDFKGGIYSGGDHRKVANGSLRITVGSNGYCQGRKPCQFKNCVTCPHLDTAFPKGTTVTAVATPGKDSRFARWGPGACKGKGQVCTFTAKKNSCISAQFLLTNPKAPPQSLPTVACNK